VAGLAPPLMNADQLVALGTTAAFILPGFLLTRSQGHDGFSSECIRSLSAFIKRIIETAGESGNAAAPFFREQSVYPAKFLSPSPAPDSCRSGTSFPVSPRRPFPLN
jgi:hypothetical protein